MPRKPRFYLPEVPVHIVQRGNDRQPTFFDDQDYSRVINEGQWGQTRLIDELLLV